MGLVELAGMTPELLKSLRPDPEWWIDRGSGRL
jgi:hypothetical protein